MNPMKTRKIARVLAVLIVVAMLLTSFSYLTVLWGGAEGQVVHGAESSAVVTDPADENYTQSQLAFLQKLISYIETNYKDKVNVEDLIHGAYNGVLESLDDPYSVYYVTEEDGKNFTQLVSGEYEGIGVKLGDDAKGVLVTAVVPNSPAEAAGLKAGDIITEVDGQALKGMTAKQGVTYIRGEKGSTASITVDRNGATLKFSVIRDSVNTDSVATKMLDGKIGYINITSFDNDSHLEFALAKAKLEDEGAASLIIDLRDNGGGLIATALNIAEQLMPAGPIVNYSAQGEDLGSEQASGKNKLDKPLVVLVNENTASASEILAGALQDSKTGVLVGNKTYGKGVAQQVINMKNGGSVKLSQFYFLTPDKHMIDHVGITPNHIVYNGDRENGPKLLESFQSFAPMKEQTVALAGQTGLNVYGAQQRLGMLEYAVDINGTMDQKTVAAVTRFQADQGLYAYGGLDMATVKALEKSATEYVYAGVYGTEDNQLNKAIELLTTKK